MTTQKPEVSVITANFNCAKYISETIKSVIAQSYQDWEMVIVDDASSDDSTAIIESFCESDNRIKLIKLTENAGPAVARNKAIEAASGRFIAFLDSDDLWTPDKLATQIAFMKERGIALSYAEYKKIDESGRVISDTIQRPLKVSYNMMLNSNYIPCLTAIYDSQVLGKMYMPLILKRQDYGLWLSILKKIEFGYCLNSVLGFYRVRASDSVSSNKFKSAIYHWKILRELEKIHLIKSIYYFFNYAVLGYLKFKK